MSMSDDGKEWLHGDEETNLNDDDSSDYSSADSNDSLENYIQFASHRNGVSLEEAISITYPLDETTSVQPKTLRLSTLLEENDIVPLFDGAGWAGTRVWHAAIWGIKYLIETYGNDKKMSLCELGAGLAVPGMVWHQLGHDVVLTDQESIMTQMVENVRSNFSETFADDSDTTRATKEKMNENGSGNDYQSKIFANPLTWSREGFHTLIESTGFQNGFDLVLNCDCVYEPLYGKSWELLVEVIDECLKVNPKCIIYTSVERRNADGIDLFVERMKSSEHVGSVEKILQDEKLDLELYVTKSI